MKFSQTRQFSDKILRLGAGFRPATYDLILRSPRQVTAQQKSANSQRRNYSSEIKDYVYNIKEGNIDGVDPSVIDSCSVCSEIYEEMTNIKGAAKALDESIEIHPYLAARLFASFWVLYHETNAGELMYEDPYGFE